MKRNLLFRALNGLTDKYHPSSSPEQSLHSLPSLKGNFRSRSVLSWISTQLGLLFEREPRDNHETTTPKASRPNCYSFFSLNNNNLLIFVMGEKQKPYTIFLSKSENSSWGNFGEN